MQCEDRTGIVRAGPTNMFVSDGEPNAAAIVSLTHGCVFIIVLSCH